MSLINAHLEVFLPAWSISAEFLADRLLRNPDEYLTDPWVQERLTLVVIKEGRVAGAAHLLRYGDETPWSGVGEIAWFLFWPGEEGSGKALLEATQQQMKKWGVREERADCAGLPVPLLAGIPDCWPHISALLYRFNYRPDPKLNEIIYGGPLELGPLLEMPPELDLRLSRRLGDAGARFEALSDEQVLTRCECICDLSQSGRLPGLGGWMELTDVATDHRWQNQGIGAWVLREAIGWAWLGGARKVALAVTEKDEQAGAGRFYRRFGWGPMTRLKRGWAPFPPPTG